MGILGAVVIGLGPLVRPDMTLVSGIVLVGVLAAQWSDGGWRARLRLVGAAVALPVLYEIFRMGYYAAVVPNTALAKNASHARWSTGWNYFRDTVDPYRLWIPLLLVALAVGLPLVSRALRQHNRRAVVAAGAVPLAGVLGAIYVVRVGGDYMHARLLLPSVWAVLVPFATAPLPRLRVPQLSKADGLRLATGAGVLAIPLWAVLCAGWWRHPGTNVSVEAMIVDGRAGLVSSTDLEHPVSAWSQGYGPGVYLNHLPEGEVFLGGQVADVEPPDDLRTPAFAAWGVGVTGYVLGPDYYVIDMLGLGDPIESRMVVERSSQPGHEKPMPVAWIAARVSDGPIDPLVDLPEPSLVIPLYVTPNGRLHEDAAAARQAIECAAIQELLDAVREPLTPGRFVDNVLAAPRLTRLDIPSNPGEAEQALC
jgi:arabinofuranosyltransferase